MTSTLRGATRSGCVVVDAAVVGATVVGAVVAAAPVVVGGAGLVVVVAGVVVVVVAGVVVVDAAAVAGDTVESEAPRRSMARVAADALSSGRTGVEVVTTSDGALSTNGADTGCERSGPS